LEIPEKKEQMESLEPSELSLERLDPPDLQELPDHVDPPDHRAATEKLASQAVKVLQEMLENQVPMESPEIQAKMVHKEIKVMAVNATIVLHLAPLLDINPDDDSIPLKKSAISLVFLCLLESTFAFHKSNGCGLWQRLFKSVPKRFLILCA